jgi:RNA-directed DNA polymerase
LGRAVARLPNMSSRDALACGLALAFLAGPWTRAGLRERGQRVLGARPPWLSALVQHVLTTFGEPPDDAYSCLREAIERAPSFKRGLARESARSRLGTLLVAAPSMGPRRWPVPELCTSADVAGWLSLEPAELDWLADVRGLNGEVATTALHHYGFAWRAKQRGGYRLLEAPKTRLKALQRRLLSEILQQVPVHEAAHGFVTGRSALSCARAHAGQVIVLRLDLEEFFPSIGAARVYRVFRSFGYPETVARILTGLCTLKVSASVLAQMPRLGFVEQYDPAAIAARWRARQRLRHRHLAQGAPTSPALANLASFRLDSRLAGAASAAGAYTRYADDLVFSGESAFARRADRFQALVTAIAMEEGFRINPHKTRLMRQAEQQRIVGLVTNQSPHVPRRERDILEAVLTNAVRHGVESQNREGDPHFLDSLRGRVAWVAHTNPAHARKLRELLAGCEARQNPRG